MAIIIRVPGVDWSGKGFPNINPFITSGLLYGFDLRTRAGMLTSVVNGSAIIPMRMDVSASVINVPDPTIMVPVDDGLGQRIELGYLQGPETVVAMAHGSAPFTVMVVGRHGAVAFPPGKVNLATATTAILYDYGSNVGSSGFTIDAVGFNTGRILGRVENTSGNLLQAETTRAIDTPAVMFLVYDGTNWTLYNKTANQVATGTNTSLSVGNPMAISAPYTDGKVNLGGNAKQTTTLHGYYPVIYQSAKWTRALTTDEIEQQYQRCRHARPSLAL